uniref:Secreted protein n=1 Tax=Caenorhabditis japonica TaxID=281687 RepID=A0A8R1DJ50_CAEJA
MLQCQLRISILLFILSNVLEVECKVPRARFRKRGPSGFSLARIQKHYDDDYDSSEDASSTKGKRSSGQQVSIELLTSNLFH